MESHDTHGWIVLALLREMCGLDGQAMFGCVESIFSFNRCLCQGSVEAPRLRQRMVTKPLANVEEPWNKEKNGHPFRFGRAKGTSDVQFYVGRQLLDHVPFQKLPRTDAAESVGCGPKPASLWWTSTYELEEKADLSIDTRSVRREIQDPWDEL